MGRTKRMLLLAVAAATVGTAGTSLVHPDTATRTVALAAYDTPDTIAAPAAPPAAATTAATSALAATPVTAPPAVAEPVKVAAAPPAPAPTPAPPSSPADVGAQALSRIDYPWQRLGFSVSFEGPQSGLLGKAECDLRRIHVYVRPSQTVQQVAFVTAFELGHAIDCGTMTVARRAEWAAIRGFAPGWTWFPPCVCTEDRYGSGDISMVFANWLVPNGGYGWRSKLSAPPSADMLDRLLPYLQPAVVG